MTKSRIREIAVNAGLCVLSIAVVSAVVELVFREAFPDSSPPLRAERIWKAQDAHLWRKERGVEIGGFVFREDEISDQVFGPGHTRLLFLGDSFTVGYGVAKEQRFTDLIEQRLADEHSAGRRRGEVHIFNAAKGGSNPGQWLRYFQAVQPRYRPHAVVAVFFLRDGTKLGTSLGQNREIIDPIAGDYESLPLYGRSAFLTYFYNNLAWGEYTEVFLGRMKSSYLGSEEERSEWRRQQDFLRRIRRSCREANVELDLVVFPILFDLKRYRFHDVEKEILDFAAREGISAQTLTPGFLGLDERTLWVASNDQHPNSKGHQVAAETLLPRVHTIVDREVAKTRVR